MECKKEGQGTPRECELAIEPGTYMLPHQPYTPPGQQNLELGITPMLLAHLGGNRTRVDRLRD